MTDRFEITFKEGGVDAFETIITGGLAKVAEKGIDAITNDNNHGWYCNITDTITGVKESCWGATKAEAQERTFDAIKSKIQTFIKEKEKLQQIKIEQERKPYNTHQISPSSQHSSASDGDGGSAILWLIGVIIVISIVIWVAKNIALPVVLLNSALILTILAIVRKHQKTLFAALALLGGGYMLLDIVNGWFSANFVNNVVKDSNWLSAFAYINSAAVGLSTWFLVQPLWANAKLSATSDKRKNVVLMSVVILTVGIATASIPVLYNSIQNPFTRNFAEVSSNRNNEKTVNQIQSNVPDKEYYPTTTVQDSINRINDSVVYNNYNENPDTQILSNEPNEADVSPITRQEDTNDYRNIPHSNPQSEEYTKSLKEKEVVLRENQLNESPKSNNGSTSGNTNENPKSNNAPIPGNTNKNTSGNILVSSITGTSAKDYITGNMEVFVSKRDRTKEKTNVLFLFIYKDRINDNLKPEVKNSIIKRFQYWVEASITATTVNLNSLNEASLVKVELIFTATLLGVTSLDAFIKTRVHITKNGELVADESFERSRSLLAASNEPNAVLDNAIENCEKKLAKVLGEYMIIK